MKIKKFIPLIIGLIILISSMFIIFSKNNKKENNITNNEQNSITDNNKEENTDDIGELKTKIYKISSDNLYVDIYEKQYTDYSRLTEVTNAMDVKYYINNGDLYKNDNGNISQIEIGGEKAKYLAIGADCGGVSIFTLTDNGNVYGQFYSDDNTFTLVYDGGDAEEILILNESRIFTTCGEKTIYILKNNQLYSLYNNEINKREDASPFSIAFYANDDSKILLYPNGSINKYIYCSEPICAQSNDAIIDEFITDDKGNKVLVSFVFSKDNINYIIDTNGNLYKINVPELDLNEKTAKYNITKINNLNIGAIDYVEVSSYTKKVIHKYREYEFSIDIEKLVIYDIDGNKVIYDKENTDSLKYVDDYYH